MALKMPGAQPDGTTAIQRERFRQINDLGWTEDHDDEHDRGQLAYAGASYALPPWERDVGGIGMASDLWPFEGDALPMPGVFSAREEPAAIVLRKRELEKAGALIAAEWDRLDRLQARHAE